MCTSEASPIKEALSITHPEVIALCEGFSDWENREYENILSENKFVSLASCNLTA